MSDSQTAREVAGSLFVAARSEQLTFLAAAIAYYGFVSTVPLAVIGVAAATVVGGEALASAVLAGLDGLVTPAAAALVRDALTSGAGRAGATALGVLVLGWSGLRLFRGLGVAFSVVYGEPESRSLVDQLRDGVFVLAAVGLTGLLLAGLLLLGTALDIALPAPLQPVAIALALSALFLPLYAVFPNRPMGVREALPGAVFAGVLWAVLAIGFGLYAVYASSYQLYGVIGGILLVLTWVYAASLVVLLGALLNVELADRPVDRQLQHAPRRGGPQLGLMSDRDDADATETGDATPDAEDDVAALRRELEALAADLESKTITRADLEADLRQYVRWRQRRGHARGWGPYLVLLYGTIMTLGAFYYLEGVWAILAMVVVWLSTLGLFVLMVLLGTASAAIGLPGRVLDRLRKRR